MKLWRKVARTINKEEGQKHQGRKYKNMLLMKAIPSNLLKGMFQRVSLGFQKSTEQ